MTLPNTLPPRAVEVPPMVIEELDSVAFAIALRVNTPELDSVAVAPEPLSVTGAYAVPPALPASN